MFLIAFAPFYKGTQVALGQMVTEEKGKEAAMAHFQITYCSFAPGYFTYLKKHFQRDGHPRLSFLIECFHLSWSAEQLHVLCFADDLAGVWIPSGNVGAQFLQVLESWHPERKGSVH